MGSEMCIRDRALMVWQVQQMVQAAALLLGSTASVASTDASFRADAVATQRTSLGLQLLNLPSLEWPEPAVKPSNQGADGAMSVEDSEPETDDSTEKDSTEDVSAADISSDNEEPDDETSALNLTTAEESDETEPEASLEPVEPPAQVEEPEDMGANVADESTVAAAASVPVEPEQSGEEQESTALDTEISEIDSVSGGSTEGHREQAEACLLYTSDAADE